MKRNLIDNIIRFFEIDINFIKVPGTLLNKFIFVFKTDYLLLLNLLLRPKIYPKINLNNLLLEYDTPYATKTFLTSVYDFYIETLRLKIFNTSKPIILDVGANIGQFLFACKYFFPDAYTYSIEPDPKIFTLLKNNFDNTKNTKIFNYALSNRIGNGKFYVNKLFSEWSSLKKQENIDSEIIVKITKGDILFNKLRIIDLLKIDVEGAELEVLKGLKITISKSRYVLIEVSLGRNNDVRDSSELFKYMFANNFNLFSVGRIFSEGVGKKQGAIDFIFKNSSYEI